MTKFRTVYKHGRKYVIPIRRRKDSRKITKEDRKKWHKNAMKGVEKWENMTPRQRRNRISNRAFYTEWQFVGKSPRTKDIIHG